MGLRHGGLRSFGQPIQGQPELFRSEWQEKKLGALWRRQRRIKSIVAGVQCHDGDAMVPQRLYQAKPSSLSVPTSTKQSVTPRLPVKSRNAARSTYLGDSTIARVPHGAPGNAQPVRQIGVGADQQWLPRDGARPLADICCVQAQPRDGRDMALQLHHFYRPKRRKAESTPVSPNY
jgi:hypothetical protein